MVQPFRERGFWGATVPRGNYGCDPRSRSHPASALPLGEARHLVIAAIETRVKVTPLVPEPSAMVEGGPTAVEVGEVLRPIG